MNLRVHGLFINAVVTTVVWSLVISGLAYAQVPIITHDELKQALVQSANARKENLAQVRSFFSGEAARKALKTGHVDFDRVQKAVSALDADDLARLAAQTKRLQSDFAAGALTNQQITYILIALGTAVIVLVLVNR